MQDTLTIKSHVAVNRIMLRRERTNASQKYDACRTEEIYEIHGTHGIHEIHEIHEIREMHEIGYVVLSWHFITGV